nr:C2 calcium-dependent membrane targeting domain containing protein [Haemonchus contortus]
MIRKSVEPFSHTVEELGRSPKTLEGPRSGRGATYEDAFFVKLRTDEFNTYVTVKLQNVKSTTAVVRGNIPCWEQEFIFETNRLDEGMIIELWSKGVLWDRLLGVHFMPLTDVRYCAAPGDGRWLQMDQELETRNGQTIGTSKPTGHNVLVDARFELPFDAQTEDGEDLQAKLQELNRLIDNDQGVLGGHQRVPFTHSGISEDSDYTSDVSFPIHQPNSSAHQWDSHLHPHRYRHHQKDTTLQASYEDEEDAYHARPDPYHETAAHPYDNDYVAEPYDRKVPSHDYEYPTYDTAGSHDRGLPSGNHKMSFDDQHYANEYGFESNGYKDEEYSPEHTDKAHYGHNPTYAEQYEGMEGSSDYREEYKQQYPGDYWNEQEPLSYNSRPKQSSPPHRPWEDIEETAESTTEKEDRGSYDDDGRHSKSSYRTSSIEKNDRRYDSDSSHRGGGYYPDEYDERRTDSRIYNWRYDSIQEEDQVKENWRDEKVPHEWDEQEGEDHEWHHDDQQIASANEEEHYATEGYQADREDSSRQNSVERPDVHQPTDIAQ